MKSEGFRLVSTSQESARRFKDETNAAYSMLPPVAEGMPNIKMMLILQFSNKIISKFSLIHKDNVQ